MAQLRLLKQIFEKLFGPRSPPTGILIPVVDTQPWEEGRFKGDRSLHGPRLTQNAAPYGQAARGAAAPVLPGLLACPWMANPAPPGVVGNGEAQAGQDDLHTRAWGHKDTGHLLCYFGAPR